jgi:CheY-like chemotaxis protein
LQPASRPRVLVVDDLETNRFLVEEALSDAGVEILSAQSGRQALEIVSASHPEVVLLDFQMPGLNGAATARRIRQQVEQGAAPFCYVVLMSGYREAEERELMRDSPADCFLARPFAVEDLRAAVEEGLRVARDRRGRTSS